MLFVIYRIFVTRKIAKNIACFKNGTVTFRKMKGSDLSEIATENSTNIECLLFVILCCLLSVICYYMLKLYE